MTGFMTSVLLYRNRVSLKEAFEGLELCEGKLSCTVLRGLDGSNPVRLLGHTVATGSTASFNGLAPRRRHSLTGGCLVRNRARARHCRLLAHTLMISPCLVS